MSTGEINPTPIPMQCEYGICKNTNGEDYHRFPDEEVEGWEKEPIYLCLAHAGFHIPIKP